MRSTIDGAKQVDYRGTVNAHAAPSIPCPPLARRAYIACAFALCALAGDATAAVVVTINGNKAKADITLPNPAGGDYTAEFEIEFENPQNLTVACLGLDADVLDATGISAVQARMPPPGTQTIDPEFPVRVTVEPPSGCGLRFDDDIHVEYHSDDLVYTGFSPYRLMKAPVGLAFHDVTGGVLAGSVRARGSGGSFSEFVIAKAASPQDYAGEATSVYEGIEARIDDPAIGLSAQLTLGADVAVSRAAFEASNYAQAIAHLDDLDLHCASLGGPSLPNVWRSARDLVNAEGETVALSGHLKFLLGRLNGVP